MLLPANVNNLDSDGGDLPDAKRLTISLRVEQKEVWSG